MNLETKKMWASEEAFNLYGIDYRSEYISLDLARKSVLPAYYDLMDQSLQNLIQQKGPYNIEFELKNQITGELHYVHSIGRLIY